MKTFRMIGSILATVCLSFCVGTNSAKLGNKTFKVPYGFWHMGFEDSEGGEESVVMMEFYSYNVLSNKFPDKISAV